MAQPFLAEIRIVSFNFAPRGWAQCNGQFLPINQNQALFSLLGTMYGGNGQTTFALPDLRGRIPMHMGGGHTQGEKAGTQSETLSISQMPAHTHIAKASSNNADNVIPTGNVFGVVTGVYGAPTHLTAIQPATITNTGGSQPHLNMQPYLTLMFCIALQGIFPSQT